MADEESPLVEKSSSGFSISDNFRPIFAEFIATLLFVFVGVMSIYTADGDLTAIGLAHGLTIALLITGFGHISGGHINPAVTLGVLISGGITWLMAIFYVIAQLLGGIVGAGIAKGVLSFQVPGDVTAFVSIYGGGQLTGEGVPIYCALVAEIMMTMVLVGTVLLSAVDTTNPIAPLAIGFAVAVDIFCGGAISGASMNPARSFGPAVVASGSVDLWTNSWIYWLGPFAGAALIALLYKLFLANDDKRWCVKRD